MATLRITHPNPEVIDRLFEHAMNIACVCARSGNLPDDDDRQRPQESGNYWFKEGTVVHLNGRTNNYFSHIKTQSRLEVIFDLAYRYDKNQVWANSVAAAIRASLGDNCNILT